MTLSTVGMTGVQTGLAMATLRGASDLPVALDPVSDTSLALPSPEHQFTVLDAAGGERPRTLIAKVEYNSLPPGLAQDAGGVDVEFSIKIGGTWRDLGSARSDSFAFARLPFPADLQLEPGLYEIGARKKGSRTERGTARLLITGNKPVLAVTLDGAVLRSRPGVVGFIVRNLFRKRYEIVPGAQEALQRLSQLYQIVYVAPLRDESTLDVTRENLFEKGGLPPGPIFTNDFGWRLKEHSRTVSYQRLKEFLDGAIAELRGFNGTAVVGGIGRADTDQSERLVMDRHGLETRIVPDTRAPWWKFWQWFRPARSRRLLAGQTVWHDIRNHFVREHPRLAEKARDLHQKQFHADPHVRLQTQLDLVSNAVLAMENSAKLYIDGAEAFAAVSKLFDGAASVFAEIYEFGPDILGNTFAKAFKDLARAGKPVRLTADFFGSNGWSFKSMAFFAKMAAAGVHVSRFVFPLAELPALLDAPFFRTHRKVAALKIRMPDGSVRDIAVLGGRNWKMPYWSTLHDFTLVVEGPVVRDVVHHLARVANEMSGSPLTAAEAAAFAADAPAAHPDGQPLRYVVHYPKDGQNIQRTFLALLRNPASDTFRMESPFPMMTEIMRELIAEKKARPDKDIVVVMGTHDERFYGPLDAYAHAQGLILKKHGIRVLIRGPLNENEMSPMHAKKFTDGTNVAICCWNPDEQSNKDLETCVVVTPNPDDPRTAARIKDMLDQGINKDVAEGIDLEDWLRRLEAHTGTLEDIYRALMLRLAARTQQKLNYFL